VFHFEKYNPQVSNSLIAWCWIQMFVLLLLISYLFANIASIGAPAMFIYGAFVFLTVYAYTELLDGNRFAWIWELIKNLLGVGILVMQEDWFGLNYYFNGSVLLLSAYFLISTLTTFWLTQNLAKRSAG
jgi:hypothetical protein